MAAMVDTNLILDLVNQTPEWLNWSLTTLETHAPEGLIINPMIYSELCSNAESPGEVDELLETMDIRMVEIPREALFLASKVHLTYRRRGGSRTSGLPDFFIGAHAAVSDLTLLTRDPSRYRTYFPKVRLICPK